MPTLTDNQPIRAGVFSHVEGAECAVRRLLDAGFPKEHITVVCADETREKHFGSLGHSTHGLGEAEKSIIVRSGLIGGLLGGVLSLTGVALTGGLGILAVGPIVAGGVAGTLFGLLVGGGVEDEMARFYEQEVARGSILVAVDDENADRLEMAARVIEECGSESIALEEG